MRTVTDIVKTALRDPAKLFDPKFFEGEVYVVNFTEGRISIQATYSGELVRMLPQHLLNTASISSNGYTEMKLVSGVLDAKGNFWNLSIILT